MDVLAGVGAAVLTQGVTFLYAQASELLNGWRARRRDPQHPGPRVVPPPGGVTVGAPSPLPEAPDRDVTELLQELKDALEPIKDDPDRLATPEGRQVVAALRDVVASALQAEIRFDGEPAGSVVIESIDVTTERVSGEVTGLRAKLDRSRGLDVGAVTVHTGSVEASGRVVGADLS